MDFLQIVPVDCKNKISLLQTGGVVEKVS